MRITRTSVLSNTTRTREIDVTPEQLREWREGALIQNAMPHLSDDDREFLISGITPEEWDEHWGEEALAAEAEYCVDDEDDQAF